MERVERLVFFLARSGEKLAGYFLYTGQSRYDFSFEKEFLFVVY